MRKIFAILSLFIFVFYTQAQSYDGQGDHKINIGYELYAKNGIKATYDFGLSDMFSIGAGISLYLNNDVDDYFISTRISGHLGNVLDLPTKLDIYPVVELGYLSSNDITIGGYAGIRYFFTENIGVFAEIGTSGVLGLSINL